MVGSHYVIIHIRVFVSYEYSSIVTRIVEICDNFKEFMTKIMILWGKPDHGEESLNDIDEICFFHHQSLHHIHAIRFLIIFSQNSFHGKLSPIRFFHDRSLDNIDAIRFFNHLTYPHDMITLSDNSCPFFIHMNTLTM